MSRGGFAIPVVTVEIGKGPGDAQAVDILARFGPRVIEGTRRGLLRGMKLAESEAVKILRGDAASAGAGRGPVAGTGVLARSVIGYVKTGEDGYPVGALGVRKGLADKYARIQELGTVGAGGVLPDIVPVRAKALAIPLAAAKDRRGVPLYSGPRDPKLAGQLFVINRKGKPGLLARNVTGRRSTRLDASGAPRKGQGFGEARGDRVEPLFVFAARSAVRPRRYLRGAVERAAPAIMRAINDGIARAMQAGGSGGGA